MALASRKDPSGCCDLRPFGGPTPGQLHSWGINSLAMSTQKSKESPRPTSVISGLERPLLSSGQWWSPVVSLDQGLRAPLPAQGLGPGWLCPLNLG